MKKIKVVHIVEALGGGIYSYLIDLVDFFCSDDRFETHIIYSDKRKEIQGSQVISTLAEKARLIKVEMEKNISLKKDFKAAGIIKKILNETTFQIIHLHSSKAGVIGRMAYKLSKSNAKVYYTPHGYSFLRKDISFVKRAAFWTIEFLSQKSFGGVTIACGDTELKYARAIGKSVLVRNGVNISYVTSFIEKKQRKRLTIGTLGRIVYQRNPTLFNEIAQTYPEIDFIWIGDGKLRYLLTAPNIKITGWFNKKEKGIKWLNELDIYLQTSLWEGLPIAVLEAMAMEKPILATRVIGNKDIVKDGQTGYLFHSLSSFKVCLERLRTVEARDRLGKNAKRHCLEKFDKNKNFIELKKEYLS